MQGIVCVAFPYHKQCLLMLVDCVSDMFCPSIKEPEELFETISQALLSSVDRDCISGWGGVVHVV